ncbi:MAG: CehA/McbA family metallohydrolase [Cyclobacteriaceae bacterium]
MKKVAFLILAVSAFLYTPHHSFGQVQSVDTALYHVRNADPREWSEFPEAAANKKLTVDFPSRPNPSEYTLSLRQYDIKLNWRVLLNGQSLGSLVSDEKDLISYFKIPPRMLKAENTLEIACADAKPDDIKVGNFILHSRPLISVLSDGHVTIEVFDSETQRLTPARITIVNAMGILQTVLGSPKDPLVVRPGHVYTGNGRASIGLPPGKYTFYAGRGFEYGIDSVQLTVKAGDYVEHQFSIKREVPTTGWVSSDTHIHTFTWSRHGDATPAERALTIAGEGLELPIMTDHNIHVDLKPFAIEQGVDRYFTPVVGNEVTTSVGHFNIFPIPLDKPVIDHRADNWSTLSKNMEDPANSKAVILNHARDIHTGFRPFDPKKHLSSAGMRLDGWEFPANAMELINSGSQQTDMMELTRDWFGMLNHGYYITPVGSSDSHDVSRFIVGQARTYIRCNDDDPSRIDVAEALKNFLEGNVMVSFGLLTEIEINDAYGPGELAPASDEVKVAVRVSGPAWTRAGRVVLYANGKKIREEKIENKKATGVKWSGSWALTMPTHDIFLVAIADGPGGDMPFWPIAKPFQPTSPDWTPGVVGISGAVWLDADKNGKRNCAKDYAEYLSIQAGRDINQLIKNLASFDQAVAIQTAALLHKKGSNLTGPEITKALRRASPETKSAFQIVIRELQLALK